MKIFLLCCGTFLGIAALRAAENADKSADKTELPAGLFKEWRHSREEDTKGIRVFRPADHEFPAARGVREGLEFKKDGTFVRTGTGPDDRSRKFPGIWKAEGKDTVAVEFKDKELKPLKIVIVSCDGKVLKIKADAK
jgi:hypothetical protein